MSRDTLPMEVEPLIEVFEDGSSGSQFGYWAKGHHDPEAFVAGCDYYGANNNDEEWLRYYEPMAPEHVQHIYWRVVPLMWGGRCDGFRFVEGRGRGAFPATVLYYKRRPRRPSDSPPSDPRGRDG